MGSAGTAEDTPLVLGDPLLFSHSEGHDESCLGTLPQGTGKLPRKPLSPLVYPLATRPCDAGIMRALEHITGGSDLLLEQPSFIIGSSRIPKSVRTLKPYRKPPGFPGDQFGWMLVPT